MDEGILRIFKPEKDLLNTKIIGKKIYYFDLISSTNDLAYSFAQNGHKEGEVFVAKGQTQGKGRLGRKWISIYDKGLYFSIILRPDILPSDSPKITLLIALALVKALSKIASDNFSIRWPNDILINNKKIAGILTELNAQTNKTKFIIVGIGININMKKNELCENASSLFEEFKKEFVVNQVLEASLKEIDQYYCLMKKKGFGKIIEESKNYSLLLGKRIKVKLLNQEIHGQAIDINKDGVIIIRQDNGFLKTVNAGDIIIIR